MPSRKRCQEFARVGPKTGDLAQPRQPLPGILNLGEARVGVFPEGEKFLVELRPASETGYPGKVEEWTARSRYISPASFPIGRR